MFVFRHFASFFLPLLLLFFLFYLASWKFQGNTLVELFWREANNDIHETDSCYCRKQATLQQIGNMWQWALLKFRQGQNHYYSSDYSDDNTTAGLNKRSYLEWSQDNTEFSTDM